jgi:glycerol uptake facilitator-like aquaporin
VTLARALSDTFAGITPAGVLAFIAAQFVGTLAAVAVGAWLWPTAIKGKTHRPRALSARGDKPPPQTTLGPQHLR